MHSYHRSNSAFEGYETWANALRMRAKMHLRIVVLLLMVFIVLAAAYLYYQAGLLEVRLTAGNMYRIVRITPGIEFIKLFVAVFIFYPAALYFFKGRSKLQSSKQFVRGARIVTPKALTREFKRRKETTDLPLGSIRMPVSLENRHTLIIGKPGSGKTQCIRPILQRWCELGRKGIVYDSKGEYFSEFYRPEVDFLFNPLDSRSLGWNLFNELDSYPDVDAVAASLIPPSISQTDPFWNDAARGVFSGILHRLYQCGDRNNRALWRMLTADANELAEKLKRTRGGEAGYRYITQNAENSRQAESVLAVMMQYTKCFEYMAGNEGTFKITDWLYNGQGIVYVTNYEDISETLKPILSLFVDLIGRKLLSMPDDLQRRIFVGLDEFGSLQRLSTIVNLLTRGRSKGACVFLGIQDDGQTEKIYTPQIRKSIDNACGNRITFALTGETAELESRLNIGETELVEIQRGQSMGPHDMRDGISLNEQKKREPLMLPSEISNLPDLQALVRLKNYDFVLSRWNWEPAQQIHEPFILRQDLLLENILRDQTRKNQKIDELLEATPITERAELNIPTVN